MGDLVNASTVSYFVDTNVFLQCHPLEQLDWTPWDCFEEVQLIVSRPVLREVDYRKNKGNDRVARKARATSAMFRKMRTEGGKVVRAANPRVVLSIEPQHTYNSELGQQLNYQERDDQLVGTLYEFSRCHEGIDVRLLTHDTTPLFTAQGLGLTGDIIPDNWLLPSESTDAEREVQSLRSEVARLRKTEPSFTIRCADQSNTELENYRASFTWYEPLTDDQVVAFMQCLEAQFPLETDFGPREPAERAPKQRTSLNVLDEITKEVFTPATDAEIEEFRDKTYPDWLERCEQSLRYHHWALQEQAPKLQFSFLAENVGTRPATDACMRTPTVKCRSRSHLQHGYVSSGGAGRRLVMPGRNALAPVAPWGAHPTCIRVVSGSMAGPSLDPACLRAPRSGRRDPSLVRRLSAQH